MYKLTHISRWTLSFSGQSSLAVMAFCVFITCEKGFMLWKYQQPYYRHKGTLVTYVFPCITSLYELKFGLFLLNLPTKLYLCGSCFVYCSEQWIYDYFMIGARVAQIMLWKGYGLEYRRRIVWFPTRADFLIFFEGPDRLWNPPSLLFNEYRSFFSRE